MWIYSLECILFQQLEYSAFYVHKTFSIICNFVFEACKISPVSNLIYPIKMFLLLLRVYRSLRSFRHSLNPPTLPVSHPCYQSGTTFSDFASFLTTSSHLNRGFPNDLFPIGFFSIIMCKSGFWPRQAYSAYCNLRLLIVSIMFCLRKSFPNSLFFLTLHSPVSSFRCFCQLFVCYKLEILSWSCLSLCYIPIICVDSFLYCTLYDFLAVGYHCNDVSKTQYLCSAIFPQSNTTYTFCSQVFLSYRN